MKRKLLLSLILYSLLIGCTSVEGDFPSLAKRPFESANPKNTAVTTEMPVADTLTTAMAKSVAVLVERHQKAQNQYIALLPAVQSQAVRAAGSTMGSEAWVIAQQAVSRLDRARADSVAALAELDALIEKQMNAETNGDGPSVIALLEPKQKLLVTAVAEQSSELDRLAKQIGL
jgi:hypothetical protein